MVLYLKSKILYFKIKKIARKKLGIPKGKILHVKFSSVVAYFIC